MSIICTKNDKSGLTGGLVLVFVLLGILLVPTSLQNVSAVGCINWNGKQDTDCDGLADSWESARFYDPNGDSKGIVLTGANPQHKDLYVEIDSMAGMAPLSTAIADVVAAYATETSGTLTG